MGRQSACIELIERAELRARSKADHRSKSAQLLPGDRAFLSPSLANKSANLTPASRRQDHTILPSARKTLSSEAPPAATASSPAFVTIAIRPSGGVDGGGFKVICDFGKPEYFFKQDWTGRNSLIRFRKLDFTRNRRGGLSPGSNRHSGAMRKHRTRNLEIPRCAIAHLRSGANAPSRNDGWAWRRRPT